jgi:indolepyruvate ferredoxin oxidoreductase beta subunit
MSVSIIIAGVGGQGSVLASRIIADAALKEAQSNPASGSLKVRVGETFGAAMRGGAVMSHVRIGDVYSPLTSQGGADLIIALEPLEGLRVGIPYLMPGGAVILNTIPMPPTDVKIGMATYPGTPAIAGALKDLGGTVLAMDATLIAEQCGNVRSMNVVMVGAAFATGRIPVSKEALTGAVRNRVPSRYIDVNLKAFEAGYEEACRLLNH